MFPKITAANLSPDEVHIWQANVIILSPLIANFENLLNDIEITRAKKFVFAKDKNRFIIARGLLRLLLGYYLKQDPKKISFSENQYGKPALQNISDSGVEFNLSHSHELVLYAFSHQTALGIDIEFVRDDIDADAIAQRFFSISEHNLIQQCSAVEKIKLFFEFWTKKEAVIKMQGTGLYHPLEMVDVCSPSNYFLTQIPVNDNYVAALACEKKLSYSFFWFT